MKKRNINFNNLTFLYDSFENYLASAPIDNIEEHSWRLLPDAEKAVKTLLDFKGKRIINYSDYDSDGLNSCTIIVNSLKRAGFSNVDWYIPERKDGYGMNQKSIDNIINNKYDLVITSDNGIVSIDYVKQLKDAGIEVIVTDHHEPLRDGSLPDCAAVVDQKRADSIYPFREICGAFVAFKLMQGLYETMGLEFPYETFLPFITTATISDVMPLLDENRTIVKKGIKLISENPNPAFSELLKVIHKYETKSELKSTDFGFYIAPLLNASSRVGTIQTAANLLLNFDDEKIAKENAEKLNEYNELRKKYTEEVAELCEAQIEVQYPNIDTQKSPVVVSGTNWNHGIVGINASRIVEEHGVPSIVLSLNTESRILKGSGRSINDISIIDMLDYSKDLLLNYGGHVGACGLSLEEKNLENFRKRLIEYSEKFLSDSDYRILIPITCKVDFANLTLDNYHKICSFEPFGEANQEPVFYSELVLKNFQIIGKDKNHVKFYFAPDNTSFETVQGIMFFAEDVIPILKNNNTYKIIYTFNHNLFRDVDSFQMNVIAVELL